MSWDLPDKTREERMQFSARSAREIEVKKRRRGGGKDRARVREKEKRSGRLVGAVETSKELAEWRRL